MFARATASPATELAGPDVISVETQCRADSVTVGERFVVTHTFTFPDSFSMLPVGALDVGKNRMMSLQWRDGSSDGAVVRSARIELITMDLYEARLPRQRFEFETPSGDTLRAISDEVVIPVRSLTASSQTPRPLKEQWVAPRNWTPWIMAAAAAVLAAALAVFVWRRRSQRKPQPAFVPGLPPDHIALSELSRIEQMGLIESGEFKRYYSLLVDVVRHYLEARFGVEAMDRTSFELLADLERRSIQISGLESLLGEADLVKFARHTPEPDEATRAMQTSREIVVRTAPKHAPAADGPNSEAVGAEGTR